MDRMAEERLRIYNENGVQQLLAPSKFQQQGSYITSADGQATTPLDDSMWQRTQAQRQRRAAVQHAKDEAFMLATQAKKAAAESIRDAQFQDNYDAVLAGLGFSEGSEPHIMDVTQRALEHKRKIHDDKQVALYQEWDTEVFSKIQGRLQTAVGRVSARDLQARLKAQGDAYIKTGNEKLGVFRDVIGHESDYNPLTARDHTLQVYTGDIRDPVKRDVLKPMYERALMGQIVEAGPVGKPMLDTKIWGDLAIHATPYGHCIDSTGNYTIRPTSTSVTNARKSRVMMDHYDYPMGDNQAASQEMGRVGKRAPPGDVNGGRGMYEIVQHTCNQQPGFTGGDSWLEARGKASAPRPEVRRGRADLTEILNQSTNPYKDGRSLGDRWLDAKGKASVPSPEVRRGRVGLTEVIQQTGNPYQDHRPSGDQWLEGTSKGRGVLAGPPDNLRDTLFRSNCPPDPIKVVRKPSEDPRKHESVLIQDQTLHPGA